MHRNLTYPLKVTMNKIYLDAILAISSRAFNIGVMKKSSLRVFNYLTKLEKSCNPPVIPTPEHFNEQPLVLMNRRKPINEHSVMTSLPHIHTFKAHSHPLAPSLHTLICHQPFAI
jgi:hypothetical protein